MVLQKKELDDYVKEYKNKENENEKRTNERV